MTRDATRCAIVAAILAIGAATASAQSTTTASAPDSSTTPEALIKQLTDSHLKALYLRCSRVAALRRLDSAEMAVCSISYETMLARTFKGDYNALREWATEQEKAIEKEAVRLSAL